MPFPVHFLLIGIGVSGRGRRGKAAGSRNDLAPVSRGDELRKMLCIRCRHNDVTRGRSKREGLSSENNVDAESCSIRSRLARLPGFRPQLGCKPKRFV